MACFGHLVHYMGSTTELWLYHCGGGSGVLIQSLLVCETQYHQAATAEQGT